MLHFQSWVKLLTLKVGRLTKSAIYGQTIPPTRAIIELEPIPEFLTIVGNNSADQTYITANAADTPNFPMFANATVSQFIAVN